jgi:hypothetical protein
MAQRCRFDMLADDVVEDVCGLDRSVREVFAQAKVVGTHLIVLGKRDDRYWHRLIVHVKDVGKALQHMKNMHQILKDYGFDVTLEVVT